MNRKRIIIKGLAITLIPATISHVVTLLAWVYAPEWTLTVEQGLYAKLFMEKDIFVFYGLLYFPIIALLTLSTLVWLLLKNKNEIEAETKRERFLFKLADSLSYGAFGVYAFLLWSVAISDLITVFFKFIY